MKIVKQGNIIAEADEGGYLVMIPNGGIKWFPTKARVEQFSKKWFQKDLGKGALIGVGTVEWRE